MRELKFTNRHIGCFFFTIPIGVMLGTLVIEGKFAVFVGAFIQLLPMALLLFCLVAGIGLLLGGDK